MDKNFKRPFTCFTVRTGKKKDSEWEWVQEILTEFELIVDSYEQSIQRPKDYEQQKKYYSGKQKRHTLKNQVVVMPSGKEIVDVVVGKTGATVDIKIWREGKEKKNGEKSKNFKGIKLMWESIKLIPLTKKPEVKTLVMLKNRKIKKRQKKE